ncbi:MAG TPA: hypothetical protein VFF69_01540 [Phycisphaerales bacterium]|nr:hypothetical protein [Phycisphaerales bacterium]
MARIRTDAVRVLRRRAALRCVVPAGIAAGALCASGASGQASFEGLGDFAGGAFASDAWRVSDTGDAVVGSGSIATGLMASRWTPMDGLVRLGRLPAFGASSFAAGVSGTGRVVVGHSAEGTESEAFLWTADGGLVSLGDLPGGVHASEALNVSADGGAVVGVADWIDNWPTLTGQAFRWTDADGMAGLGYARAHHDLSMAYAASANGSTVVGISMKNLSDGEAFVWTEGTGMVGLGDLPGWDNYSIATDVTPDGATVVGGCSPSAGYEAFRWTQGTGMTPLGDFAGGDHYSIATGVTADGQIIVGTGDWDGGLGGARAFIWDETHGLRDLKTVLETEHGLDLTGWSLLYANDISADGSVIVGQGINLSGEYEGWIARIAPAGCGADYNGDGVVDTRDVIAFLNAWTGGC